MSKFPRGERLRSRKEIDELFSSGKSITSNLIRTVFIGGGSPAKAALSAPKRIFKRAIDRNRVKRLMRESYRHNKEGLTGRMIFIFQGASMPTYKDINTSMLNCISRLR